MGISRSAFYKALSRKRESHQVKPDPDECRLVARIKELVARFPDYGYRRIWALLRFGDDPIVVNRKRVQRLMRVHGTSKGEAVSSLPQAPRGTSRGE